MEEMEMDLGKSFRDMRLRQELTQENVASDLHISKQLVSHIETNRRNMSDELVKDSAKFYNDAIYGFEVAREFATDYITPLVTANKAIEMHRLALEEVFKQQATEAIDIFNEVSLVKNPEFVTENELEQIKIGVKELLDVQAILNSFLALLEQEYGISIKQCMRKRVPTWKAMGWIE